ncbi:LysM peptidoglycan-binding domain-containing protein [Alsobacter sp. R-9]
MSVWVKIAILIAGLVGIGTAVHRYGLPVQQPAKEAAVPAAPATPSVPASPAVPQTAAPAAPATAPAAPSAPAPAQQAAVPAQPAPTAAAPATAPAPAAKDAPPPPAFDIVRVEPTGDTVVAGRTLPGARITLLRNGEPYETVVADGSGQFALVPRPLPPGNHELTLSITLPDGQTANSRQSVTVAVPTSPSGEVIVALTSPDAPTRLLSAPKSVATPPATPPAAAAPTAAAPAPSGPRPRVVVTTVEAEDGGKLFASGQANPGATVRLYINDTFLATAVAGADGRWSFTIGKGLEQGAYRVRLDDVDPANGTVLSRAEVPFQYTARPAVASATATPPAAQGTAPAASSSSGLPAPAAQPAGPAGAPAVRPAAQGQVAVAGGAPVAGSSADVLVPEIRSATVTRGDSLWRISKRVYGKGVRYTVIYEANQQQIRDPARIYPGQIFVLPGERPN